MKGFFPKSTLGVIKAPVKLVPRCGACGLYRHCKSPKMEPRGKGLRKILLIGEAPGEEEDLRGKPFVGPSGMLLESTLQSFGVDMHRDCVRTNAIICHPKDNETPDLAKIGYCRPNLVKTIDEVQPEIIIPLGTPAVQALLTAYYKEDDIGGIMRWSGWRIPCQRINTWICPTVHPSFVLHAKRNDPLPAMLFRDHIKRAVRLQGRPWEKVPDYKRQVEVILDHIEAALAIYSFHSAEWIAFDYETTTLKPEYDGAAIVCCSMTDGQRTIAYPWLGDAIEATRTILRSPTVRKIASNIKFEERWTLFEFGKGVRGWGWDTMESAHCIDNRPDITSIKFQSFVLLGAEAYDEHIKKFLRVKGQRINKILEDVEIVQLLTYCGMDSLLEFHVARKQQKRIGVPCN